MPPRTLRRGEHVHIRRPAGADRDELVAAARRSTRLHRPWVVAPDTPEAFDDYLRRYRRTNHSCYLICRNRDDAIVGAANLGEIVRGVFQNAFLGYYAFTPHARKGSLREGLELVIAHAFADLGLHRIHASVRPENVASTELLRGLGFRLESRSPRSLFLDGDWRDHLGFVLLNEPAPPVFAAHGSVSLHEVDSTNWREVADVKVDRRQRAWVTDVSTYLALCAFGGSWQPLAIRADSRTVGFVMWARDPADGSYWIGGFMIDRREQTRGYGRAALTALVEALRAEPRCRQIALSYRPDNVVARDLYASLGFRETGETEGDETVARLAVRPRRRT